MTSEVTSELVSDPIRYPLPAVSIRVTFAASDGRLPEELTVELNYPLADASVERLVDHLAGLPDRVRYPARTLPVRQPPMSAADMMAHANRRREEARASWDAPTANLHHLPRRTDQCGLRLRVSPGMAGHVHECGEPAAHVSLPISLGNRHRCRTCGDQFAPGDPMGPRPTPAPADTDPPVGTGPPTEVLTNLRLDDEAAVEAEPPRGDDTP